MIRIILFLTLFFSIVTDCVMENYPIRPKYVASIVTAIPTCIVTIFISYEANFSDVLVYVLEHKYFFVIAILVMAIMPVIAGILIDLPISIVRYADGNNSLLKKIRQLSIPAILNIAENGDPKEIIKNEGRVNLKIKHILYFLSSNISGAISSVFILLMAASIDDLKSVIREHSYYESCELVISGTICYLLIFISGQQKKNENSCSNPDNYILNRAHQICNALYLFVSQTISYIFIMTFLIYGFSNLRGCNSYSTFVFLSATIVSLLLFFYISGKTEYAGEIDAQAEIFWKYTPYLLVTIYLIVVLLFFKLSWIIILCALLVSIFMCTVRYIVKPQKGDWHVYFPFILVGIILFALLKLII